MDWFLASVELGKSVSIDGSQNPGSLDELVREHIGRVRSFIFPMVCDPELADDLTQETFLKAVRSISQFQNKSKFSTWLCKIAMNTCRDHFRKNKIKVSTTSLAQLDETFEAVSHTETPFHNVMNAEMAQDVQAALIELPVQLRAAVTLVYIHGMSAAEAAEVENCTLTTMYWRIHQSKKKLGKLLARYL